MNKKSKIILTLAGAGIMGMLTGCGAAEPMDMSMSLQPIVPETIEQPESSKEAVSGNQQTVSGNNILDQLNQPFGEEPLNNNTNQAENGNINNASSGEITSGENKQSEPNPNGVTEVIALTDSEEEANRIAQLYQIELKSFGQGVAVYTTDKNVADLIQMGKDNNYPEIALNNQYQLY